MEWKDQMVRELTREHLFENTDHRTRFKEIVDCYCREAFFTPGLCKCMYLSCFDEEHFSIMLDMLNQLKLNPHFNLGDMKENGELMEEEGCGSYDEYVMRLSCAFLMDQPFDVEKLPENLDKRGFFLIRSALRAAEIIDNLKEEGSWQ